MTLDSVQTSEYTAMAEYWTTFAGGTTSESEDMSCETTLTVVDESVSITVPAGTFDCCKIKAETTVDGSTETEYWYYSTEVGFYVKQDAMATGLGDLELEEYSFGKDDGGIVSLFTGDNIWLTILIIIVVVMIVAAAIAMRSRRGKIPTQIVPPQPGTQMPPPPAPGPSEVPPPGGPIQPPQSPPPG